MVKIYLVLSKKDVLDKKYMQKTLLLKGLKTPTHLNGKVISGKDLALQYLNTVINILI